MSYFSFFPNVYVGEGISDNENYRYRLVKNIFRRVKVREDLDQYVTQFEAYSIREGDTPESLARVFLGDGHLDWVILMVNNITDFYEQWLKKEYDLQKFVRSKYSNVDGIHHYETQEALDGDIVVTKKGIEVLESYRTIMPDGTALTTEQSRFPVSNYEHEVFQNELKRQIMIPTSGLADMMVDEALKIRLHTTLIQNSITLTIRKPHCLLQRGSLILQVMLLLVCLELQQQRVQLHSTMVLLVLLLHQEALELQLQVQQQQQRLLHRPRLAQLAPVLRLLQAVVLVLPLVPQVLLDPQVLLVLLDPQVLLVVAVTVAVTSNKLPLKQIL